MNKWRLILEGKQQTLTLYRDDKKFCQYLVSTGANGFGEEYGSEKTPTGWHQIRAKIGANYPKNAVFVGRRFTQEIYSPELAANHPGRDWILTRIMWLSGLEIGKNRLGPNDTMRRMVYLHGTPDEISLGQPGSRGCVRMANQDIIELFDLIPVGTPLHIIP